MDLVRGSEVGDFTRCRWRWKKAWIEKIRPIRPNGKLFFGNLFHKFSEVYYDELGNPHPDAIAHMAMLKLFEETNTDRMEQVELDELWGLACEVTTHYVEQWRNQDAEIYVLAQEMHFAIPLDERIAYAGTIDLLAKDRDNRLRIWDHKTTDTIDKYAKAAEMDRQISRYWWAVKELTKGNGFIWHEEKWCPVTKHPIFLNIAGAEVAGFIYNIILKDYPKPPKQLAPTKKKPVAFSVDKRQMTSYDVYMQTLSDSGLMEEDTITGLTVAPEEYREILQALQEQETSTGNRYFQRLAVTRQQGELDSAMEEFLAQASESVSLKNAVDDPDMQDLFYRNIQPTLCGWDCNYKALCIANMDGSNISMLQNLMYEHNAEEKETKPWLNT